MQERQALIPNVWSVIFGHLEPCFLFDVMRVSKAINSAASHDIVFYKKLQQYFPNEWQAVAVPEGETHKAKFKFKTLYAKKFSTLKSSASRRLLSYIIEGDLAQIRKFPVDGDALFSMLQETDADGNDMLFYINRAKSADLNGEVMKLYLRSAVTRVKSWNPLTILDNWADKLFRMLGAPLHKNECVHIYELAAAFNLQIISHLEKMDSDAYYFYDDTLAMAVRFGHLDAVELLLGFSQRFERAHGRHFGVVDNHPLVVAAKYNQPEIVSRLLEIEEIAVNAFNIGQALYESIKYHCPKVFELLLDAYFNVPDIDPQNLHHFITFTLLNALVDAGHADSFEMLFKKLVYRTEHIRDAPAEILALDSWDMRRLARTAAANGSAGIVELLLKKMMEADSPHHIRKFIYQAIQGAIENGKIDVVNVYLNHGYVPHKDVVQFAKQKKQPEIFKLLNDARVERRQEKMRRLAP